jgi:hypothetical protein
MTQKKLLLYVAGLKQIAREKNVCIKEAAEIAEQDLNKVGGTEHIEPLRNALKWLTDNQKNDQPQSNH